jgi:putative tricarboxylic transport membrane protein
MVCGSWLVYEARTGGWRETEPAPGAARGDWTSLAWVVAGVVANAALITTIGFILACTVCFMLAVRGLRAAEGKGHGGAKGLAMDFITGFLIAAPAFWLFTLVLGINLPNVTGTGWL